MNAKEFKEYLESKTDKIAELRNKEILNQLNFSMREFINIISEVLNDEEKEQILPHLKNIPQSCLEHLINSITKNEIKLKVLYDIEMPRYMVLDIIKNMNDECKMLFLHSKNLHQKLSLDSYDFSKIIQTMSQEQIESVLKDKSIIHELFDEKSLGYIVDIIIGLQDEEKRLAIADEYDFNVTQIAKIINSCSDKKIQEVLLSRKYDLGKFNVTTILSKLQTDNLLSFFTQNSEFIQEYGIKLYEVVKILPADKQEELALKIINADISKEEKLKALVALQQSVKENIDRTQLNDEYKQALDMPTIQQDDFSLKFSGTINVDLDGDLTIYKGYDELIAIRPQEIPLEKHDKLLELAKICPNLRVYDSLDLTPSRSQEFISAEMWIKDVISHIPESWTDIQKIAYVDYRVGKKISYTPDYDTEVEDYASERALWRIISTGYGVCNGISQVEQYILEHVGIKSERVGAKSHSFLKLEGIEIPKSDGSTVIGTTIIDPTWNLTSHRYDAFPNLFGKSYEEIRKYDINAEGIDKECHRNDQKLSDATIDIEEDVVRQIFASIGIAKENGDFYISDLMSKSDEIAKKDIPLEQKTQEQLSLLATTHPDFYKCQNSTISILAGNILNHPEMNYQSLIVNRVYDRNDDKKTPLVYVYCQMEDGNRVFFVTDTETQDFKKMDIESFAERYECYEMDLQKNNGLRPWETEIQREEDLARSSGKIKPSKSKEEDER